MLLKTIVFDEKSSFWSDNRDYNLLFIRTQEMYINDIIRYRGYIYLNQICEILGVEWNTEEENLCVIKDSDSRVTFIESETFYQPNNSLLVNILCYDKD
jgi:hypothetical protein